MLKRPWKVMTLGLLAVAGVLSELMMAWRRLPVPLSSSVLTLKVDRSWRPSRDSMAGRRRRAARRRAPAPRAFGAFWMRWNPGAGMVEVLGLGWAGRDRGARATTARARRRWRGPHWFREPMSYLVYDGCGRAGGWDSPAFVSALSGHCQPGRQPDAPAGRTADRPGRRGPGPASSCGVRRLS